MVEYWKTSIFVQCAPYNESVHWHFHIASEDFPGVIKSPLGAQDLWGVKLLQNAWPEVAMAQVGSGKRASPRILQRFRKAAIQTISLFC